MKAKSQKGSLFQVRNLVLMSLLAALVVVLRLVTRVVNLKGVKGDGSAIRFMPAIIGKGLLPQFGSCTTINLLAGGLISLISPSEEGILTFVEYITSGLILDILYYIFRDYPRKPLFAGITNALANLTKLSTNLITYRFFLGLSWDIIFVGFSLACFTNAFFGFVFGYLASSIFRLLAKPIAYVTESPKA